MGGDARGDGGATCKTAGYAYTGSNPVPATSRLTSNNAVSSRPFRPGCRVGLPSGFPPADALPTVTAQLAPPGRGRVGADTSSTLCDLGLFVDEPAQSIDPHDPHVRWRREQRDGSER